MSDEIKIFKMNDYDWWAGRDLEGTITAYRDFARDELLLDESEVETENARELTPEEYERLKFVDGDDPINADGTLGGERSFKEQLQVQIRRGDTFPCFFASTEW